MPYTTHGHWYGPGEPTEPGPRFIAKCFGLGGCETCRADAGLPPPPGHEPPAGDDVSELRTAAALIRRRGTEATPGPWHRLLDVRHKDVVVADLPHGERPQRWRDGIAPDGRRERVTIARIPTLEPTGQHIRQRSGRDLEWIALMDPRVADHIAGWLEACADDLEGAATAASTIGDAEQLQYADYLDEPDSARRALDLARLINGTAA